MKEINDTTGRVMVAGDVMLDIYHYGGVSRICPEAPVPIFHERDDTSIQYVPGGASNVAVNLMAAGIETVVFSAIGKDENGEILLKLLRKNGIDVSNIIRIDNWITTTKLRYIGQNNQQILRVDREETLNLDGFLSDVFLDGIKKLLASCSMLVVSDYQKGFLTEKLCRYIIELAKEQGVFVLVDVKDKNCNKYRGADILKPNRAELSMISGMPTITREQVIEAAKILCRKTDCKYVLTTLGVDGMVLANEQGRVCDVKSVAKEVYDVTGAGDTALAYMAAELVRGATLEKAVETANYAAGIQVSKIGTSVVWPEELERFYQQESINWKNKILSNNCSGGLMPLLKEKEDGKKIVFSNGCFDILHSGHIECLRKARSMGDCLVVAVNGDDSVKRLKGSKRPINSLNERMTVLAALECVDYVIAFEEDTPLKIIRTIIPDVLVKGGDYKTEEIVGYDVVCQNGGIVTTIPLVEGKSTTDLIRKIGYALEERDKL